MTPITAKLLICLGGAIAIPTVGYFIYTNFSNTKSKEKETWDNTLKEIGKSLSDFKWDISFANNATLLTIDEYKSGSKKDTFGGKLANYFMSTETGKNEELWSDNLDSIKNKTNIPKDDGFFKEIKDANATVEKLKEVCSNKYNENFDAQYSNKAKWDEVWKYCAVPFLQQRPRTIEESSQKDASPENEYLEDSGETNKTIGQELKSKLLSTEDEGNKVLWSFRWLEFATRKAVLTREKKYQEEKEKYRFFLDDSRKGEKLKDRCKDAYSKLANTNSSSKNSPTKEEVLNFCSIAMIKFSDKANKQ